MTRFFALLLVATAMMANADESVGKLPPRYQHIVDRFPFGEPPPGFDPMSATASEKGDAAGQEAVEPEIPLSQQQEALQRTVTATAIVFDRVTSSPWLGFSDTSNPKSPRAHYVQLGMSEDGWTVVDINMEKKTARLSKDDVEIDVVVGARPEPQQAKGDPRRGTGAGLGFNRRPISGMPGRSPLLGNGVNSLVSAPGGAGGPTSMASLRTQRREREAAQQQQFEEDRKARQAAAEEARRQQEEEEKRRAQERAEREAERAAEREEYNQRVKNLAAALEEQMAENRRKRAEEGEEDE